LKIGIVSDIHGNIHALKAVEEALNREGVEEVWSLGDTIGYGAFPSECVSWVRENCSKAVLGNHELAALGFVEPEELNDVAAKAVRWSRERLSREDIAYLRSLPLHDTAYGCRLVHDTPAAPGSMEYILDKGSAYRALLSLKEKVCLFGHTHIPVAYRLLGSAVDKLSLPIVLIRGGRYLINPGSVGQPRDRDPRASFGVLDLEENAFYLHRIEYNVKEAARAILNAGLPEFLAARLLLGV
jgi:predicted phosphodiesterase